MGICSSQSFTYEIYLNTISRQEFDDFESILRLFGCQVMTAYQYSEDPRLYAYWKQAQVVDRDIGLYQVTLYTMNYLDMDPDSLQVLHVALRVAKLERERLGFAFVSCVLMHAP